MSYWNAPMNATLRQELMQTLKQRFQRHQNRHQGIEWQEVLSRLESDARCVEALLAMEQSGGEPDVVVLDDDTSAITFCDCSPESPVGRRSLCYDGEALAARKKNKPAGSVCEMAATLGIQLLTESQYRALQQLGEFDTKTSSWIQTPSDIRAKGGALFCDRRYGHVFVYHNGADSYFASRGFRGLVCI